MSEQQPNQPNIPAWAQQPAPPVTWGAPTPQPPKRSHRARNVILGVVGAVIVIGIIGAATGGGSKKNDDNKAAAPSATATTDQPAAAPSTKPAAPAPKKTTTKPKPKAPDTVEYIVIGSPAEVTYGPAGSSLSGHSGMHISKKLGHPSYYSISAQLSGSGKVTCEIKVKGKVVSHATATGSYNIAMCEIVQDPIGDGWTDANSY